MTWAVMARVDGQAYSLFGVPTAVDGAQAGELVSAEYTSTHTTFVVSAGSVDFALDYFSPVAPHNYTRQSMPYSYLTVSASSNDGSTPQVQVYSDADKSWIGQFGDVGMGWNFTSDTDGTQLFQMIPQGVKKYAQQDNNEMAQWGSAVYCTRENASKLSRVFDSVNTARSSFVKSGALSGEQNPGADTVVAYSHDLGTLQGTENVTFVIGNVREPAINYLGNPQSGYYRSSCQDVYCDCVRMLDDLHDADAESRTLDAAIQAKAESAAGSGNYSDILALSVRQAFGSLDLTIPTESLDTAESMVFVKEISSDGNVNTIDVLMPMAPIFYVLAPDYIRLSLQPVMDYLASGAWPHNYTVHDIGSNYPQAVGHHDGEAEFMPVEECGNLLSLVYMYELATGDTSWKLKYLSILQEHADFLVLNGLYPTEQRSTDDGAGPRANQTGLTVKAAIALNAFGVMTGQQDYTDVGLHFADELYNQGIGTDPAKTHFTLFSSQQEDTWALHFNLYLDVLLKLNTFPSEALVMQTNFYPSVRQPGGVPLDSTLGWSKTDWMIFGASTAMAPGVNNQGVRDMFIDDVPVSYTHLTLPRRG